MHIKDGLFTSECVSLGHPDKLCDRISDAILDGFLELDPNSRVACETLAIDGRIIVAGEFKAHREASARMAETAEGMVREAIRSVGYGSSNYDIDPDTCRVELAFNSQAREISTAVDGGQQLGAGDQGMMFGYACEETPDLMPLAWSLATRLVACAQEMNDRSRFQRGGSPVMPLRPDGKAQVTVRYGDGRPAGVQSVVMSWQHDPLLDVEEVRAWLDRHVVQAIVPVEDRTEDFVLHLNPGGRFTVGGPKADTGLTGRKIIVDTYGGAAPHGGGAFSGKDPSKVDRSGAYAARWIAKNLVAAGLAGRVTVQLSYAIGIAEPVSVAIDSDGTGTLPDSDLEKIVRECFDLTPDGIIEALGLRAPIYTATSSLGHFGSFRDPEVHLWEATNKVGQLQAAAKAVMASPVSGRTNGGAATSPTDRTTTFEELLAQEDWCTSWTCTTCGALPFRRAVLSFLGELLPDGRILELKLRPALELLCLLDEIDIGAHHDAAVFLLRWIGSSIGEDRTRASLANSEAGKLYAQMLKGRDGATARKAEYRRIHTPEFVAAERARKAEERAARHQARLAEKRVRHEQRMGLESEPDQ
jgi:S-adenosylmethionine synthetase